MHRFPLFLIGSLVFLMAAGTTWAVKPAAWVHEQPQDFLSGELKDLVVTSMGRVRLGRKKDTLLVCGDRADVINTLAQATDGRVYAAGGPKGVIYRIDGEKVTEFATLPEGGTVFSLLFTRDGDLLAGTGGGGQAVIYRIDGRGEARVFFKPPGTRYVWAMVRGPEGEVYAATGVEGQLYVIEPDGAAGKVLADVKPHNLLCLAYGPDGMLYAGTDQDGLVYRINPANGKLYVMYDAPEPEISSIAIDEVGNIYVATADAAQARPGRTVADAPGGRPDGSAQTGAATQPAGTAGRHRGGQDGGERNGTAPTTTAPHLPTLPARLGKPVRGVKRGEGGNAIYRIDSDGFVTEVFREPVMILGLAESQGTLYAATGNEGRIYAVRPAKEETVVLAKLKSKQVTCLLPLPDDALICGTANAAQLVRLGAGNASTGTLTSKPLDAGQIVKWGRVKWDASIPEGTRLTVATRSGNVEDPESDAWEAWSGELDATVPQQIASAGARFLQYRLTFETTRPDASPTLRRIELTRIEENRPPRITSLKVLSARQAARDPKTPPKVKGMIGAALAGQGSEAPEHRWVVTWEAEDPNQDSMEFQVFYRQVGDPLWIRMAKELKQPFHVWDTRTVPDGWYEVRVLATDEPANPPDIALSGARVSDPVCVDNTPPDVTIGAVAVEGTDRVTVNATMTDALSSITKASYSVDSDEKWLPLAALDDIFDSPREAVSFSIHDLPAGPHRVALRVSDEQGNTRYVTQLVTVKP